MNILNLCNTINDKHIAAAVKAMTDGEIIIYPTDTVYAFGCDALQNSAIQRICDIKKEKTDKTSLSIICADIAMAAEYARISNDIFRLMRTNVPGPFTFILPALSRLPKAFKGRKTVGIRIPENEVCQALIEALGHPILTSSVPIDDEDYATEPELLAERYAREVSLVLDAGRGDIEASTVIDCLGDSPEIIRQGKGELVY